MGGWLSSEEKKIEEEHRQRMEKDSEQRQRDEEQKKKEIEDKRKKELAEEQASIDVELNAEKQERLERTAEEVKNFNEMKKKMQKKIDDLQRELKEQTRKIVDEQKTSGMNLVTDGKNKLKEDKELLVKKNEFMMSENERLTEARRQEIEKRKEMVQSKEQLEMDRSDKHFEDLKKLNTEKNNVVRDGENKMTQLSENLRTVQKGIKQQEEDFLKVQMGNAYDLLAIHHEEQQFDDFRRKGMRRVNLSSRIRSDFDKEEVSINTTREDIERGVPLSRQPDFFDVSLSIRNLMTEMSSFELQGAGEMDKYETIRKEIISLLEKLTTALNEMESRIERYTSQGPTHSNEQRNDKRQEFNTDSDSDDTDITSEIPTPPASVRNEPKSSDRRNFSITEQYNEVKTVMRSLNDAILKLNVPASTEFEDTLTRQIEGLTISHSQIVGQITSGVVPSTSDEPRRITDTPSTSSSQPAIEEVEKSEDESGST
ncbi:hypothetical protein L3Y34_008992 [Caenorhabditis briggsae]|nr:hypothetical protein L3Y34_008992 [Caenorhabditis briggsae]